MSDLTTISAPTISGGSVKPRRSVAARSGLTSKLTWRILAVNMLAPVILVAGLIYLDRYRNELIDTDMQTLRNRAEMVAAAVAEGAVNDDQRDEPVMSPRLAREMVRRLSPPAQIQAWLFTDDGQLLADSRDLISALTTVQVEVLPPPRSPWLARTVTHLYNFFVASPLADEDLPEFVEPTQPKAADYPEVMKALNGDNAGTVRRTSDDHLVLSAAVPVQHYKEVLGVVMATTVGDDIRNSMFGVRLAIFEAFGFALLITVGLSLYMAGTITNPIRGLAAAAERVRRGQGRRHAIPDLSHRHDEIGELSSALREMTEALWRRMDAIEAFAADVAHEIKNPLSSLRSAVETVALVKNDAQRDKLLAIIQDDVVRLARLINDISDASRVDAELSRADTASLPLRPMLLTLADVYEQTGAAHGIRIEIKADPAEPLQVVGIESRLGQVMRNLLANALSFSPPDGRILLVARKEGDQAVIEIEDDGPGIPEDKLEAIFDRFYSERPEGEKFGTHSGLGLSISRQIIEAHGGTLTAANRKDPSGEIIGARFTLRLPSAPTPPSEPSQRRPATSSHAHTSSAATG